MLRKTNTIKANDFLACNQYWFSGKYVKKTPGFCFALNGKTSFLCLTTKLVKCRRESLHIAKKTTVYTLLGIVLKRFPLFTSSVSDHFVLSLCSQSLLIYQQTIFHPEKKEEQKCSGVHIPEWNFLVSIVCTYRKIR